MSRRCTLGRPRIRCAWEEDGKPRSWTSRWKGVGWGAFPVGGSVPEHQGQGYQEVSPPQGTSLHWCSYHSWCYGAAGLWAQPEERGSIAIPKGTRAAPRRGRPETGEDQRQSFWLCSAARSGGTGKGGRGSETPQAALLPEIPASSIPAWPQQAQPHQGRRLAERPVSIPPPPPAWALVLSPALSTSTRQPATGRGLLTRPSIHTPDWLRETQPSTAVCADWKPF